MGHGRLCLAVGGLPGGVVAGLTTLAVAAGHGCTPGWYLEEQQGAGQGARLRETAGSNHKIGHRGPLWRAMPRWW